MKTRFMRFIALLVCSIIMSISAQAEVTMTRPSGKGVNKSSAPYLVGTLEEFMWVVDFLKLHSKGEDFYATTDNVYIKLTADIDLSPVCGAKVGNWEPISLFFGELDGNGHTIKGLYINQTDESNKKGQGLFGKTSIYYEYGKMNGQTPMVKNLTVEGSVTSHTAIGVGLILGDCEYGAMRMENVTTRGHVEGTNNVGGLCGYSYELGPKFKNCINEAEVVGSCYVGGICGNAEQTGSITGCTNRGTVKYQVTKYTTTVDGFGGIFGRGRCNVTACTNEGTIDGIGGVGGIVGTLAYGDVNYCLNTGEVKGNYAGGIVGSGVAGSINYCYSNATVWGSYAGLILGNVEAIQFYQKDCTGNGANGTIKNSNGTNKPTTPTIGTTPYVGGEFKTFTDEELASGSATAYLQGSDATHTYWTQDLSSDKGPSLNSSNPSSSTDRVYVTGGTYNCNNELRDTVFSNDPTPHFVYESHNMAGEYCSVCGTGIEPGKVDDVYQIGSVSNLVWFAHCVRTKNATINAVLTKELDMTSYLSTRTWIPIPEYAGSFNGQNHTISGFSYTTPEGEKEAGLFASVTKGASLSNLTVKGKVQGRKIAAMIVSSVKQGSVSITNCHAQGTVTLLRDERFKNGGTSFLGGIVGFASTGTTLTDCTNRANLTAEGYNSYVGGICAYNGKYTRCANYGNINAEKDEQGDASGIAAYCSELSYCANYGNVAGNSSAGGVTMSTNKLMKCLNVGNVSCKADGKLGAICVNHPLSNTYDKHVYYSTSATYMQNGSAVSGVAISTKGDTYNQNNVYHGVSKEVLAKGGVCWDLNQGTTNFGQKMGTDVYPVVNGPKIYQHYAEVCSGQEYEIPGTEYYTNSEDGLHHMYNGDGHYYVGGGCVGTCGQVVAPEKDTDGYYLIEGAGHLVWLRDYVNKQTADAPVKVFARQTCDFSLSQYCHKAEPDKGTEELNWEPIGKSTCGFWGVYDGGNHNISNIYINSESNFQGLFGIIGVKGKYDEEHTSTVKRLKLSGNVKGNNYVGLLAGHLLNGEVSMIRTTANNYVTGKGQYIGGVVGRAALISTQKWTTITDCTIWNSYVTTTSSGNAYAGGIVGYSHVPVIRCEKYYGSITAQNGVYVGGIVGYMVADVPVCMDECAAMCDITGSSQVGGLIGVNQRACNITNSYSNYNSYSRLKATATDVQDVHTLVGKNAGKLVNCYYYGETNNVEKYADADVIKVSGSELTDGTLAAKLGGYFGQDIDCGTETYKFPKLRESCPVVMRNGKPTNYSIGVLARAIQVRLEYGIKYYDIDKIINGIKTK